MTTQNLHHIWYPFTQMTDLPNPSFRKIVRGKGNLLFDEQGKSYLDAYSSLWVNLHGHCHPKLVEAIQKQVSELDHSTLLGSSNQPVESLSDELAKLVPVNDPKFFYSDSGSTSVEIGIKIAFQYWQNKGDQQKRRFLSLTNAYHGDTLGMVGLGGISLFHEVYAPIIEPSLKVTPAYEVSAELNCLEDALMEVRELFERSAKEIAAFVVEPIIQGAAGILKIADGYLQGISALCKEFHVLLVVDEVAVGFGRTGKMFACEWEGVKPDILCLAKGISGGVLPLAATVVSKHIYEEFLAPYDQFKAFFHGHSYTGNPIACAAALASLQIFEEEQVLQKINSDTIPFLMEKLEELKKNEFVINLRGKGLFWGVELGDKKTGEAFTVEKRVGHLVCMDCIENGVMIRPLGSTVPLIPPLSIQKEEIEYIVNQLNKSILKIGKSLT